MAHITLPINTYTYLYIHMCTHYTHAFSNNKCIHIGTHIHTGTHIHNKYIQALTYKHTYRHICMHIHKYAYTQAHAHTCIHTCIPIYISMCTYTPGSS